MAIRPVSRSVAITLHDLGSQPMRAVCRQVLETCAVRLHPVDGPPARLSRGFRVRTRPCVWSGAPEPVLRASRLPFLASFVSPALRFLPACYVHLPPPPATRATSPQHSDEASVPSLSPDRVPSLFFARASARIRRMSSPPAGFPLGHRRLHEVLKALYGSASPARVGSRASQWVRPIGCASGAQCVECATTRPCDRVRTTVFLPLFGHHTRLSAPLVFLCCLVFVSSRQHSTCMCY